jgi:hypothetical protein
MRQANWAFTDDQYVIADFEFGLPQSMQAAGENLSHRRRLRSNALRQLDQAPNADHLFGDVEMVGHRPGDMRADHLAAFAQVILPMPARSAVHAGNQRCHGGDVPGPEILDIAPKLGNGPSELMAENDRQVIARGWTLVEHPQVRATNAAVVHAKQNLSGLYCGLFPLKGAKILLPVQSKRADGHGLPSPPLSSGLKRARRCVSGGQRAQYPRPSGTPCRPWYIRRL